MDRRFQQFLWTGIAAWIAAGAFLLLNFRLGFVLAVWTIPVTLVVLANRERKTLPIWNQHIPLSSARGLSYVVAFLANLYWPLASVLVFQALASVAQQAIFWLYLLACLAPWAVLLFFSGGKQPTMSEGRFVPFLYCVIGLSLALFL